MLRTFTRYTALFAIILVLLGHYSLQVHALDLEHKHTHQSCASETCHHQDDIEICSKFQGEQINISSEVFVVPDITCSGTVFFTQELGVSETHVFHEERIPLSYIQLARSHL